MSLYNQSSTPSSYTVVTTPPPAGSGPPPVVGTYVPNTIRGLVRLWLGDTDVTCLTHSDVDVDMLLYMNGYTGDPTADFRTQVQTTGLSNGITMQSAIFIAAAHGLQQEALQLSRGANVTKVGNFSFDYREQYKAVQAQIKELYRMASEESSIVVDLSTHFVPYWGERVPVGDW